MLLVLIGSAIPLFGQSYTIKVSQLDSLLWMAAKYRAADSALNSATASIQALRQAISEKTEVVTIQGEQLKNYLILIDALKVTITNDRKLAMIEKMELKGTIKKLRKGLAGTIAVIGILVAVILGG